MKILFITTAHNSLSQRLYVELTQKKHHINVLIAVDEEAMCNAVEKFKPELIICPMLKSAIPKQIWMQHVCLIVHPGIVGDRGASSLDWAIMEDCENWGVTILQAAEEMDAGDIWAYKSFKMRNASKSALYRLEVTEAAVVAVLEAVTNFESKNFIPTPLNYDNYSVRGTLRPSMKQSDRKIDWNESTEFISRKIRAADSFPGVIDTIYDEEYFLYGVYEEDFLKGIPGTIIGQREGAICIATGNGAVWITHLKKRTIKDKKFIKLPSSMVLGEKVKNIPEISIEFDHPLDGKSYRDIWYEESNQVGYLYFDFYNGAMSTHQCNRLLKLFKETKEKNTKVIVLMGGEFWSNGINLNTIEASNNAAKESWDNINAMNDLILEILTTESHLIISAMQGNSGAGGVILGLAADIVYARTGVIMNPHYKSMGNLYGSEYWTYLLPKRVGFVKATELTEQCLPIGSNDAQVIGLLDGAFGSSLDSFKNEVKKRAEMFIYNHELSFILAEKSLSFNEEKSQNNLKKHRAEELRKMWENFYGEDSRYHEARNKFVYKIASVA